MNILFIGQCEYGSTSRMRFEIIELYYKTNVKLINISPIIKSMWKPFRSIGWRFQIGPLIHSINKTIKDEINNEVVYDLVWVEKGVFIKESTLFEIRKLTKKLVHFTPDPAFFYHQSRHFNNGIKHYDFCITTKKFELQNYFDNGTKNVIYCTQGFDENIHKPMVKFDDKIYDICFIGHHELERELILSSLLNEGYSIALAGIKWTKFVKRNSKNKKLYYFGSHVAGEGYSLLISQSKVGLGLLSKWIPEKHTTRTFEIPACGTLLVSEKNDETVGFFNDNEVLFYEKRESIPNQIAQILKNISDLKIKTIKGREAVVNGNFSHNKIMMSILEKINN
jgi:spore maturation protein CgeB